MNDKGPRARRLAEDIEWLQRAVAGGHPIPQVAAGIGVSTRTAYRYLACRVERVEVGGWLIAFAVWPDGRRPTQLDTGREHSPLRTARRTPTIRAPATAGGTSDARR